MNMELNKIEVMMVADVSTEANDTQLAELTSLQLALIGGGCGEVVMA
jgi:hypothetical protein